MDGGIPQGCPLSMIFIVALYVPCCRHLDSLPDVKPQLYAEKLNAVLHVRVLHLSLLVSLVRTYRLVSVFFSVLPRLFERP